MLLLERSNREAVVVEHVILGISLLINLAFALILAGALAMKAEVIPRHPIPGPAFKPKGKSQ